MSPTGAQMKLLEEKQYQKCYELLLVVQSDLAAALVDLRRAMFVEQSISDRVQAKHEAEKKIDSLTLHFHEAMSCIPNHYRPAQEVKVGHGFMRLRPSLIRENCARDQ